MSARRRRALRFLCGLGERTSLASDWADVLPDSIYPFADCFPGCFCTFNLADGSSGFAYSASNRARIIPLDSLVDVRTCILATSCDAFDPTRHEVHREEDSRSKFLVFRQRS